MLIRPPGFLLITVGIPYHTYHSKINENPAGFCLAKINPHQTLPPKAAGRPLKALLEYREKKRSSIRFPGK